jgi:hypothetical protein
MFCLVEELFEMHLTFTNEECADMQSVYGFWNSNGSAAAQYWYDIYVIKTLPTIYK